MASGASALFAHFSLALLKSVVSAVIVEKLLEYMSFKAHYETVGPKDEIPVNEFMDRIPPEIVLELYVLAFPRYPPLPSGTDLCCDLGYWLQITKTVRPWRLSFFWSGSPAVRSVNIAV